MDGAVRVAVEMNECVWRRLKKDLELDWTRFSTLAPVAEPRSSSRSADASTTINETPVPLSPPGQ